MTSKGLANYPKCIAERAPVDGGSSKKIVKLSVVHTGGISQGQK